MTKKTRIQTDVESPALGTYSQAIRTGDLVFVTGQTGREPGSGKLEEGLEAQTRRVLANVDAILDAAGCTSADIVKATVLLADIKDFKAFDVIYGSWLPGDGVTPPRPARTAFQAAALPAGALVMLESLRPFRPDSRGARSAGRPTWSNVATRMVSRRAGWRASP